MLSGIAVAAVGRALHPDLAGDRSGVAHAGDVVDLVAAPQVVEISGQHRIAMEVEQGAFLREQESELAAGIGLGDLPHRLVRPVVVGFLGAAVALLLDVEQLPLGDVERLVDRLVQVGALIFAHEVVRLVTDHDVRASGQAELDVDHRRDGAGAVAGALVDAHAAGRQAVINPLQIRDPRANLGFGPFRMVEVVKSHFQGHLHAVSSGGTSDFRRISPLYANARKSRIVAAFREAERRAES